MRSIFTLFLTLVSAGAATYTYDHAGQLIAESYSNGSHAFYEYDNIGNPIKRTTIAPNASPQANLAVTSSVSPSPATAGAPVTITINVTNNGPDRTLISIIPYSQQVHMNDDLMARLNLNETIQTGEVGAADGNLAYEERPGWFRTWEDTRLITFDDKNGDG